MLRDAIVHLADLEHHTMTDSSVGFVGLGGMGSGVGKALIEGFGNKPRPPPPLSVHSVL